MATEIPGFEHDRRQFLQGAGATITAGMVGLPGLSGTAAATERYPARLADPFTLGVASGDPTATSVVLWTRLAPAPLEGGGMPTRPIRVRWVLATDPEMRHVVRQGSTLAVPQAGHSVHVDLYGLDPDRWYWYAFEAGPHTSPVGRTRTLPWPQARVDDLSFAFVSCQEYQFGWYTAYRRLAEEDVDFVVHLGDYLYESGAINPFLRPVRTHEDIEVTTLEQYRHRYAVYKLDPDLQAAHQAFPFITTWDDHEVDNDWAGSVPEDPDSQTTEQFLTRKAFAARAFYEHLPLSARSRPRQRSGAIKLYRDIRIGDLATLYLLDTRQFRSDQPCGPAPRANPPAPLDCDDRFDPGLTMLGDRQERWLTNRLRRSSSRWNIIASTCWFAPFLYTDAEGRQQVNTDQWDGYPVARQRLIDTLQSAGPANPVFISGDWHVNGVSDITADFADPSAPVVATEFACTSISSVGPWAPIMQANLAENPHVRYVDGDDLRAGRDVHGYVRCSLTPERWITDFRVLDSVKVPDQAISTTASFVVDDGVPGARPI